MLCLTFLHVSLVYYFAFYDSHIASCNKDIIQVIIGNFVTQTLSEIRKTLNMLGLPGSVMKLEIREIFLV